MEADLIALMQEAVPDAEGAEAQPLNLTETCQALRDKGHAQVRPDLVETILRGMAQDGRDQDGGRGNLTCARSAATRSSCGWSGHGPWSPDRRSAAAGGAGTAGPSDGQGRQRARAARTFRSKPPLARCWMR
jgi:hypothetical protein